MLENVADSVSNGGLEGYASRVESRKVYANELAWLEDCVHRQIFTLSQGKCKRAAWHHSVLNIKIFNSTRADTNSSCEEAYVG